MSRFKRISALLRRLFPIIVLTAACQSAAPYPWHGDDAKLVPSPDFSLPVAGGGVFRLSEQVGKTVLLYFGYTSCPDVCPTTLADLKQAITDVGSSAGPVQVVFVTIDPARDSNAALKAYADRFESGFIGLRGEQSVLDPILKAYDITVIKEADGTFTHTSVVLLIDPKGRERVRFPFGILPKEMAADIIQAAKAS